MKQKILGLTLLLIMLQFEIQCQPRTSDVDVFLKSVVFVNEPVIRTEKINGQDYEIYLRKKSTQNLEPWIEYKTGTAFFIAMDLDLYLVTAEHVAKNTSLNTSLVFSSKSDNPIVVQLRDILVDRANSANDLGWTDHPEADISAIRVNLEILPDSINISPIPYEWVYYNLDAPQRQVEITAYGFPLSYPLKLGPKSKFSPVTKTYKAASGLIDMTRFDNGKISTFYLVDDPSVSGLSGSPVIALPHTISKGYTTVGKKEEIYVNTFWLMGIVHGTISDKTGGYGAITPSIYIAETIELAPGFDGVYTYKYNDGKLWSIREYKNGKPWTVISNLNRRGESQEMGTLKNGDGSLYIYDEFGNLEVIQHYKNGHVDKTQLIVKKTE
ncbi:MAG: hypothetical protein RIG77_25280 [Cyclobacteriaceae bacterium]